MPCGDVPHGEKGLLFMKKTWGSVAVLLCASALSLTACTDDTSGSGAGGTAATGGSGGTGGGGSGGTGGGGSGGTGGGGTGGGDDAGSLDQDAGGSASAVATIAHFGTGTVTGTATFTQDGDDVTVVIVLNNCPDGAHPVHIHEGTSCADATAQGPHWDTTRGEGIPDITCASDTGTVTYTRLGTDAKPWTISAGDAASDIDDHAFVVHDTTAMPNPRVGCGLITAQ